MYKKKLSIVKNFRSIVTRVFTVNGAYASFEEDIKGKLQAGMLADFVIIDKDVTKVDAFKIKDLQVLQTYVGGRKVFDLEKD